MEKKRFVASYSGGKDSVLAIHRAIRQGMEPACLIITYNTDAGRSWFHGIPEALLEEVSDALKIPIHLIRTGGEAYRDSFVTELRRQKQAGVDCCVFGDIDIDDHLAWCEDVCREAGLEACFPLWKEARADLVREFIASGFTAEITIVDTTRLSEKHLKMKLSEEALESIGSEGADICGENGEYHSFVSDGPLFLHPVAFTWGETVHRGNYAIAPVCKKDESPAETCE